MYIIVGLGNPTSKYAGTRHNIGFDAITQISDTYQIPLRQAEHKALTGKGYIEGQKVVLAQPQTYMNLSGESVRLLADYYKVSNEEIIVLYDDISLEPGQLRIRTKGSAGGHNGIKSMITCLGTLEFPRVKIGVGSKPAEWDLADYVLSRFPEQEEPVIRRTLGRVEEAVKTIISDGTAQAMNIYNKKVENP